MTPEELELMKERMNNLEAYCKSIERDFVEHVSDNLSSNDQWVEKRLRVLEDKVKWLIEEIMTGKGLPWKKNKNP